MARFERAMETAGASQQWMVDDRANTSIAIVVPKRDPARLLQIMIVP